MPITKKWVIENTQVSNKPINGFDDVIVTIYYRCSVTNTDPAPMNKAWPTGHHRGIINLQPPAEGDKDFVPLDKVTKDVLLGWAMAAVNAQAAKAKEEAAADVFTTDEMETHAEAAYTAQLTPPHRNFLPKA